MEADKQEATEADWEEEQEKSTGNMTFKRISPH
jgi:hypothetical protein